MADRKKINKALGPDAPANPTVLGVPPADWPDVPDVKKHFDAEGKRLPPRLGEGGERRKARKRRTTSSKKEEEVLQDIQRIPRDVRLMLGFAPTRLDEAKALEYVYGVGNVEWRPASDVFVVREGKKLMKTDEEGITMADFGDIGYKLLGSAPELATGLAAWSIGAQAVPQLPHTKLGLLALTGGSMAAASTAGAVKDAMWRKWGIKEDADTGEIAARRGSEFAIGTAVGYPLGRVMGLGKLSPNEAAMKEALDSVGMGKYAVPADELMAQQGTEAAKRLGIKQTAGQQTLKEGVVKLEAHGAKAAGRAEFMPGVKAPMKPYEKSFSQGVKLARGKLAPGEIDQGKLGTTVGRELEKMELAARAPAVELGSQAERMAVGDVMEAGQLSPQTVSLHNRGKEVQKLFRDRQKEWTAEVRAKYEALEKELEGSGEFVDFKNLREAIAEARKRLPQIQESAKETVAKEGLVHPKTLTPLTPTEVVEGEAGKRVGVGVHGVFDPKTSLLLKVAKTPQTFGQAQTQMTRIGDDIRAQSGGELGSTGFDLSSLNKFLAAAKQDLDDSFVALKPDAKLSTMYRDATKAHAQKIDALNESQIIQRTIRAGRSGGTTNPSDAFAQVAAGGGKHGDLILIKKLLGKNYNRFRDATVDRMVGRNTVELPDGTELLDLSKFKQAIENSDDGFLRELFDAPRQKSIVPGLKTTLRDWEKVMSTRGSIGKTGGIDMSKFENILADLQRGNTSAAREKMAEAITSEVKRRNLYFNNVSKEWKRNSFDIIEGNPEQFVDDFILSSSSPQIPRKIFDALPPDLQQEVQAHTADRLIARAFDLRKTPVSRMMGKGQEINPTKLVDELYGNQFKHNTVKHILNAEQIQTLEDLSAVMLARARYDQIAGGVGGMATETSFALNPSSFLGQVAFARAVFSGPGQEALSGAVKSKGAYRKILSIIGKDPTAPTRLAPEKLSVRATQALKAPLAPEVKELYDKLVKTKEELDRDMGPWGDVFFDAMFGELPRREQIEEALGPEIKKQGK